MPRANFHGILSYDNTESQTKVDPTSQAVEPARLISAYGKVCLFSIIYVIGTQLAIFNVLSAVPIPFYHVSIRFVGLQINPF